MHPTHHVLDHPLAADALVALRHPDADPAAFRNQAGRLGVLLAVEAAQSLPHGSCDAPTPLGVARGSVVSTWPLLVPILRAGLGLLDTIIGLLPGASVALIGTRRDDETLTVHRYCDTIPSDLGGRPAWLLDPMLATGGTLADASAVLAKHNAGTVSALCVLAAPEGLAHLAAVAPDLVVYCAGIDERLDERGYILPGLGDAGDRLYGPASFG
jgi:uracil phosphoribosyltransferase